VALEISSTTAVLPSSVTVEAKDDSITVVITQPATCGIQIGAAAAISDQDLSMSLTFSAPSTPVPCAPVARTRRTASRRATCRRAPTISSPISDLLGEGPCASQCPRHLRERGDGNKLIARQLGISEPTIKARLVHIFEKLRVDNRTAAAREQGLITGD
jgi:hypothetical protein